MGSGKKKKYSCSAEEGFDLNQMNLEGCEDFRVIEKENQFDSKSVEENSSYKDLCGLDLSINNDVASAFALREGEMHHVERIQMPFSPELSEICQKAKSLRNKAVFFGRQIYFLTTRDNYPLAANYPAEARRIYDFMSKAPIGKEKGVEVYLEAGDLAELKTKLFKNPALKISEKLRKALTNRFWYYNGLNDFLKRDLAYKEVWEIHSQVPQQILKVVGLSWKGYFEAVKIWSVDPNIYLDGRRPNIPHFGRKYNEFPIIFPDQPFKKKRVLNHYNATNRKTIIRHKGKVKSYETGELIFPEKTAISPIRTKVRPENVVGVRIVPRGSVYIFEVIFGKEKRPLSNLIEDRIVAIDIGLNILMTITNNFGKPPILIRGNKIKSDNQLMNKTIARLQSARTAGTTLRRGQILPETMEMKRIRINRNNKISDAFHKASRFLINYCAENQAKKIVIGYNKYWKSGINLLRKVTQNFVFVPFYRLITKIQYKAELLGIEVVLINEAHTSKCSALDFEPIKHHDKYLGVRGPTMKGRGKGGVGTKRYKARGLFKASDGTIIHSDVNGAFNIGRRAFPQEFGRPFLSRQQMLLQPIEVKV